MLTAVLTAVLLTVLILALVVFSNSPVPLLLLGTAGGAPVNPVGMTPQELAKRCGLVFQFPERYFLGGTLQDVSTWPGSCCLFACLESLLVYMYVTRNLMYMSHYEAFCHVLNANSCTECYQLGCYSSRRPPS